MQSCHAQEVYAYGRCVVEIVSTEEEQLEKVATLCQLLSVTCCYLLQRMWMQVDIDEITMIIGFSTMHQTRSDLWRRAYDGMTRVDVSDAE